MNKLLRLFCVLLSLFHFLSPTAFASEKVFFYHTDPAGTPIAMTDSIGNVVWTADYKPFGEEQATPGIIDNNREFVGKEKDTESGMSYFGARYMRSEIGRFISPDPVRAVDPHSNRANEKLLANPQRLNAYAYGLNNPYRYIDPDGLSPEDRVRWSMAQIAQNKQQWKGKNQCNEFVRAAHVEGDPDAKGYFPEAMHYTYMGFGQIYPFAQVKDLANPEFAKRWLEYMPYSKESARSGDVIVWYDGGSVHHTAIYIGNGEVIYQSKTEGVKRATVDYVTKAFDNKAQPVVRRFLYERTQ